jgi:hypothetical protein
MPLTDKRKVPSARLFDYTTLLYGYTKIGKSTLLNQVPKNLFLNTGGGLEALDCYEEPIATWEKFLEKAREILTTEHVYEAITIDTIDRLHKLCSSHVMQKHNISHASDLDWGKGYELVKDEFMRPIMALVLSKFGVFFVSHSKDVEIQTRTAKITKRVPSMQNSIYELITPICGIILFYDTEETPDGERRMLRTRASEKWIAGDRTKKLEAYGDIIMDVPPANNWEKIQGIFDGKITKENQV